MERQGNGGGGDGGKATHSGYAACSHRTNAVLYVSKGQPDRSGVYECVSCMRGNMKTIGRTNVTTCHDIPWSPMPYPKQALFTTSTLALPLHVLQAPLPLHGNGLYSNATCIESQRNMSHPNTKLHIAGHRHGRPFMMFHEPSCAILSTAYTPQVPKLSLCMSCKQQCMMVR